MGMDIHIWTNNAEEILEDKHPENRLSRTFLGLVGNGDLQDIANRASVNIAAINDMAGYDEDMEELEAYGDDMSEAEKKVKMKEIKERNKRCNNNIDRVIKTVDTLINAAAKLKNLADVIHTYKEKHHRKDVNQFYKESDEFYFSDFHLDKDDRNFGYNFGFDLRIFQRFVAYAKEKGATMVYFIYM